MTCARRNVAIFPVQRLWRKSHQDLIWVDMKGTIFVTFQRSKFVYLLKFSNNQNEDDRWRQRNPIVKVRYLLSKRMSFDGKHGLWKHRCFTQEWSKVFLDTTFVLNRYAVPKGLSKTSSFQMFLSQIFPHLRVEQKIRIYKKMRLQFFW